MSLNSFPTAPGAPLAQSMIGSPVVLVSPAALSQDIKIDDRAIAKLSAQLHIHLTVNQDQLIESSAFGRSKVVIRKRIRSYYRLPSVGPGQSSVRKGVAGNPVSFVRLGCLGSLLKA